MPYALLIADLDKSDVLPPSWSNATKTDTTSTDIEILQQNSLLLKFPDALPVLGQLTLGLLISANLQHRL